MFSPDFFLNIYFVCKILKKRAFTVPLQLMGKKKRSLSVTAESRKTSFLMQITQTGIKVAFKSSKDTSGYSSTDLVSIFDLFPFIVFYSVSTPKGCS